LNYEKEMISSESAPEELSSEWSCRYVSTILIFRPISALPPISAHGDRSHHQSLKSFETCQEYEGVNQTLQNQGLLTFMTNADMGVKSVDTVAIGRT
jgi:hypothetical protein